MRRFAPPLGLLTLLAGTAAAASPDPQALAERIDRHVEARWKDGAVIPAPVAEDAEFHRRAYLDLTGRIPSVADVRAFLADKDPDKRRQLVDRLLESPRFALHFANVLRAELTPETASERGARTFQPGFEAWLRQQLREGAGYDRITRDLIAAPIAGPGQPAESVFRDPSRPNPLAFYAVKDAKPESLAATVARTFLGVQIECAQCHDHPFARWSREQFWSQAAFFAGIERQGEGLFNPLTEDPTIRVIAFPNTKRKVAAAFLDEREPDWTKGARPREALADWVTAPDNPFFARATVNRLWGHFFGHGIVEPVDDFRDDNPPSHPELLDELARSFVSAKFDLRYLIRAVCTSRAYNLSSARSHSTQDEPRLFARMTVKGLTGEQFFDSLAQATGYRDPGGRVSERQRFLERFARQGKPGEPETSVPQALTLLNGSFVSRLTRDCPTLAAASETPLLTTEERAHVLYLSALGRPPSAVERQRLLEYISAVETGREPERLADLFWALLNSAEFRLNH